MLPCSPCHFFRFGTAHILLLGLLADFWAQWLPAKPGRGKKKKQRPEGPGSFYMLPKHICKAISDKAGLIMLTELFGKPYRDIVKYAPAFGGGQRHLVKTHMGLSMSHQCCCQYYMWYPWLVPRDQHA